MFTNNEAIIALIEEESKKLKTIDYENISNEEFDEIIKEYAEFVNKLEELCLTNQY